MLQIDTTEGVGANSGIRTRTARLGRPAGNRYPTFALDRPTGIAPVPPRWRRRMLLPHPGRSWTGDFHRPIERASIVKDPALASSVSGPSARTACIGDS